MKRKQKKREIAARLAASLTLFYPELQNIFLCPTCLIKIPLAEMKRISDAHIIPEAAGGKITTLTCTDCNSTFGHRQDKWAGEYIHMVKSGTTLLHTRIQKGYFEVGGHRVGGTFEATEEGGLNFYIHTNRTSPKNLAAAQREFATGDTSVTLPLPLLENRHLVDFGLLTSAYLLWFRELGYSWVLQRHLDPIRTLILNADTASIPKSSVIVTENQVFPLPWVGVGRIAEEICLITGIADRLIFFPPTDRSDLYNHLPADFSGIVMADGEYRVLRFYDHHNFDAPLGIVYHDRLILCPDTMLANPQNSRFLLYPPDESEPQMIYPTPADEFERMKQNPGARGIKIRGSISIPDRETGRE